MTDVSEDTSSPPITDFRSSRFTGQSGSSLLPYLNSTAWGQLAVEMMENVPQLQWPQSNYTYHAMRNDSQIDALYSGLWMPITRMRWSINPNGADPDVVDKIAADYNLPVQGSDPDDDLEGFDFTDHIYHAMLAALYGHMYFDQWGEIQDDGLWHVKQLREMMPQTLTDINVSDNGDLESVKQAGMQFDKPPIPSSRIVPYVWSKEGSNWVGRSMLRPLYRDWLLKDRALRVNVINIQRAGAGIPNIEAPPGATPDQIKALDEMAQAFRAGEDSGGATPNGAKLRLVGVEGQQPDVIRTINYHDEAMARSFMAMVIQLGQTKTGSRALGGTFADIAQVALEAFAGWFQNRFNRFVIRRDVRWNYADQKKRCPKLVYEIFDNPNLAVADFVMMIDKGAIRIDTELLQWIRKKYRLPPEDTAEIEKRQADMIKKFQQGQGPDSGQQPSSADAPPGNPSQTSSGGANGAA